ncbi:MAG: T9SS type A sorting domain-containing protein, partial [Bacteroidota bacterium]
VFMVYVEVEEIFSNDVYFWYNADNGAILMQYVIGDGFFIGTSLRYLSNITIATGIEDPGYLTDLVYPNPMGEQFRLSFSSPEALQIRYSLTNQLGQRISFGELSSAPSFTHSLQFETADLKPGIYYLTLIDQNNPQQFRTLRLVK